MKRITIEELAKIVRQKYNGDAIIKFFNSEEHAIGFQKGDVCLGTFEYFRQNFKGEGRSGETDGIYTSDFIVGEPFDTPIGTVNIDLLDKRGVSGHASFILTGLLFCSFHFVEGDQIFDDLVLSKKNLGNYVAVITNKDILGHAFSKLCYKNTITKGIDLKPKILDGDSIFCSDVEYTDTRNGSGFQKEKEYAYQHELRFCFKIEGKDAPNIYGSIAAQFIFSTYPIQCELYELTE